MAKKAEVEKYIKQIVDRLNDVGPDCFPDWGGSVMFLISDLKTGWKLKMAKDGSVESCVETTDESNCGVLEMNSDSFVGVYSKKIDLAAAKGSGAMKWRGDMDALMKILPTSM